MPPIPKRQHYVPILHLKHFVGQQPQNHVWTYDKLKANVRHSVPDETGLEAHFYSAEKADGSMDTRLETYLSKVEGTAAPIYENLVRNDEIPTDQQRMDFAHFLALMYARTPTMRRLYGEMSGQMLQTLTYAYGSNDKVFAGMLKRYEADTGKKLTLEEAERLKSDFVDPSNYTIDIHKERTLEALNASDKLTPMFFDMTWTVSSVASGFLFTSDNPILKQYAQGSFHPIYGDGGFLNKTVRVSFPLSPKKLLTLSWSKSAPSQSGITRQYAESINEARAAHSERFLYAHIHHKNISKLAAKYAMTKRTVQMQGYGPKNLAAVKVVRRL